MIAWLRLAAIGLLAGLLAGIVVAIGGRIAMRIVALKPARAEETP